MKKFTNEYSEMVNESLENKLDDKITEPYVSLKRGVIDLLDKSIEDTSELVNVQNFMNDYINEPEPGELQEFVEDSDIFNFYLKYQSDCDDICNDNNWFDESPKNKNIFSLYDNVLEGTKFAVVKCMEELEKEIF